MTRDYRETDIYGSKQKYLIGKDRLRKDSSVTEANKAHIFMFLDDCELGKTILTRAKKRIKPQRLMKYLYMLKQMDRFLKKDFKSITQTEMEQFIRKLEDNSLSYVNTEGKTVECKYSVWTRHDYKVTLKKFYKWLLGNNREYPSIVSWFDTHVEESDPPALSIEEIRALAEYSKDTMRKAMVWILFETGARAGEFLNIRLRNVTEKDNYFLIRIEVSKTFRRTIPIYEARSYLNEWLDIHPEKGNQEALLFPSSYPAFRIYLKRLGQKVLKKNIHPHLFRHSYATWLAGKKVGRYQMCKLMGWTMSSDMPDRYIDRLGVIEQETLNSIRGDELVKSEAVNSELKKELTQLQMKYDHIIEQLEQKKATDNILDRLVSDQEVQQLLSQKIREMGLKGQLMAL